jgi:hypothetical protein
MRNVGRRGPLSVTLPSEEEPVKSLQDFRMSPVMSSRQAVGPARHRSERAPCQYAASDHGAFSAFASGRDGQGFATGMAALLRSYDADNGYRVSLTLSSTCSSSRESSSRKHPTKPKLQSPRRKRRAAHHSRKTRAYSSTTRKTRSSQRCAISRGSAALLTRSVASQFAEDTLDFAFSNAPERDQDSFGVDTRGRLMLVERSKLDELIQQLEVEGDQ